MQHQMALVTVSSRTFQLNNISESNISKLTRMRLNEIQLEFLKVVTGRVFSLPVPAPVILRFSGPITVKLTPLLRICSF
jgi:hypothetical protein